MPGFGARRLHVVTVWAALALTACADPFDAGKRAHENGDYATALREWTVLADGGHPEAQSYLGLMHSQGQGVAKDDAKAAEWFRRSAEQGFAKGQFNLGVAYARGLGVEQDIREAFLWFSLAEAQGVRQASDGVEGCIQQMTREQVERAEQRARTWQPAG